MRQKGTDGIVMRILIHAGTFQPQSTIGYRWKKAFLLTGLLKTNVSNLWTNAYYICGNGHISLRFPLPGKEIQVADFPSPTFIQYANKCT